MEAAWAPIAEGEEKWVKRLDKLGVKALNESHRFPSSPAPERKSLLYYYGKQMVWFFSSFVLVGIVIWMIARKAQGASAAAVDSTVS